MRKVDNTAFLLDDFFKANFWFCELKPWKYPRGHQIISEITDTTLDFFECPYENHMFCGTVDKGKTLSSPTSEGIGETAKVYFVEEQDCIDVDYKEKLLIEDSEGKTYVAISFPDFALSLPIYVAGAKEREYYENKRREYINHLLEIDKEMQKQITGEYEYEL